MPIHYVLKLVLAEVVQKMATEAHLSLLSELLLTRFTASGLFKGF